MFWCINMDRTYIEEKRFENAYYKYNIVGDVYKLRRNYMRITDYNDENSVLADLSRFVYLSKVITIDKKDDNIMNATLLVIGHFGLFSDSNFTDIGFTYTLPVETKDKDIELLTSAIENTFGEMFSSIEDNFNEDTDYEMLRLSQIYNLIDIEYHLIQENSSKEMDYYEL